MRFLLVFALAATAMLAGDVLVQVGGIAAAEGAIGCALFAAPKGFPKDNSGARAVWLRAERAGLNCKFPDVAPGPHAVSVARDSDGIPAEPWGVSNTARPMFAGAALTVAVGK